MLALLMRGERVLEAAGIALHTEIDDDAVSLQLDSRSVFNILRAMQEALTNTARHSKASNAFVRFDLHDNLLAIFIQDDGIGFVLDKSLRGHGITNITRRMHLLGGFASIAASPNTGCSIELSLPLRTEHHE